MDFKLINGDCLEELNKLKDNSVDLVLIDPPYNIGKDKWDKWKTVELYVDFLSSVFLELQRVLKDNGSFYFFHNDFIQIVEIQNMINKDTDLIFKQLIVWNKRFKEASNKGFLDGFIEPKGLRNYQKMAEYCLFYTFQDETGRKNIDNNLILYKEIRDYFKEERKKTKLSYKDINLKCFGTAANGGGMASNILTSYKKGWTFPTEERYNALQKIGICQKPYKKLRKEYEELRKEYEELRKEYESQRYTFNNQKTHHSVWDYEIAKKAGHITPKTTDLLENIIKHSSNEGDTVLDCFMGSGSTGVACKNTNRNFIGIELDKEYFEIAKKRIEGE